MKIAVVRWCVVLWIMILIASCAGIRRVESLSGIPFETMSARFRLTMPLEGEKVTLKGNLKIKDGEMIQASVLVPMIRSEAARIEITTDSVLIIDRVNKYYATGHVSELNRFFGTEVDYPMLQSIFTNDFSLLRQNKELRHVKVELSNLEINKTDPKPTTVSSRYTQVGLLELIKMLDETQ